MSFARASIMSLKGRSRPSIKRPAVYSAETHLQWCREIRNYLRQVCPLGYQLITNVHKLDEEEQAQIDDLRSTNNDQYTLTEISDSSEDDDDELVADAGDALRDAIAQQFESAGSQAQATPGQTQRGGGADGVGPGVTGATGTGSANRMRSRLAGLFSPARAAAPAEDGKTADEGDQQELESEPDTPTVTFGQSGDAQTPAASSEMDDTIRDVTSAIESSLAQALKSKRHKSSKYSRSYRREQKARVIISNLVSPEAWASLSAEMRIMCYRRADSEVYDLILTSLTVSQEYHLAGIRPGAGVAAWKRMLELQNERSGQAQSHYLSKLLNLRMSDCTRDGRFSIRAYASRLTILNDQFACARGGAGAEPEVLRAKLYDLPRPYWDVVRRLQEDEDSRKLDNRTQRTIPEIIEYIYRHETRTQHLARSGRAGMSRGRGRRRIMQRATERATGNRSGNRATDLYQQSR